MEKILNVDICDYNGSRNPSIFNILWWDDKSAEQSSRILMSSETVAVSICTRILKYGVWKIEFDELDFFPSLNSIFAGYTGSKNLVQTWQKFQFIKLDFSSSIYQNPSADR